MRACQKITPCCLLCSCRIACSRSNSVPVILLSTSDIPAGLLVRGEGCLVQTRVCKAKKKGKGEENASSVSSVSFSHYSMACHPVTLLYFIVKMPIILPWPSSFSAFSLYLLSLALSLSLLSWSQILPFLEYSLHARLMHKLKVKGMNAVFGVKVQVVAGDTMVIGVAVSLHAGNRNLHVYLSHCSLVTWLVMLLFLH